MVLLASHQMCCEFVVLRHWLQSWLEQNQPSFVLLATVVAIFVGLYFLSQSNQPAPAGGPLAQTPSNPAGTDSATPSRSAYWSPGPDSIARPTPPSASRYDMRSASAYRGTGTPGYGENMQSPLQPIFGRSQGYQH